MLTIKNLTTAFMLWWLYTVSLEEVFLRKLVRVVVVAHSSTWESINL